MAWPVLDSKGAERMNTVGVLQDAGWTPISVFPEVWLSPRILYEGQIVPAGDPILCTMTDDEFRFAGWVTELVRRIKANAPGHPRSFTI